MRTFRTFLLRERRSERHRIGSPILRVLENHNSREIGQERRLTVWTFGSIAEAVAELAFLRALKLLQRQIEDLPHHSLFRPGDPIAVVLQTNKNKPTINWLTVQENWNQKRKQISYLF